MFIGLSRRSMLTLLISCISCCWCFSSSAQASESTETMLRAARVKLHFQGDADFERVVGVEFDSNNARNELLRLLPDLAQLEWVSLQKPDWQQCDLTLLRACKGLRMLTIFRSSLDSANCADIAALQSLDHLKLIGCILPSDWAKRLAALPCLRILNLTATHYRIDRANQIAAIKSLRQFSDFDSSLNDEDLEGLANATQLERLSLQAPRITDRGFARLSPLTSLIELRISADITDEGCVAALQKMMSLRIVFIRGRSGGITDSTAARLSEHRELVNIEIGSSSVTDDGLAKLALLPDLRQLSVQYTKVSCAGLKTLIANSKLEYLQVSCADKKLLEAVSSSNTLVVLALRVQSVDEESLRAALKRRSKLTVIR